MGESEVRRRRAHPNGEELDDDREPAVVRRDAGVGARAGLVEHALKAQGEALGLLLLKVCVARRTALLRGSHGGGHPEDAEEEAVPVRRACADLLDAEARCGCVS